MGGRERFTFIARMPDQPGALMRAAEVIGARGGNIVRLHYDHRIDPSTVFFEVEAERAEYARIQEELERIGYLQRSLKPHAVLKCDVHLPHKPKALMEFLAHTTEERANITLVDFDEKGTHPDRLKVSLSLEEGERAERLLDRLKSRYPIEIIEYDPGGRSLDDTVFYVRFAQELRTLLERPDEEFILRMLHEINHIVQELHNLGVEPKKAFTSVLETGRRLKATTGANFYADLQSIGITDRVSLHCIQPPCGGNVYALASRDEVLLVDTGFGIYHEELRGVLASLMAGTPLKVRCILITHGDPDHAGGAGLFSAPVLMHEATKGIISHRNRAYASEMEASVLESVYTRLISEFSRFTPPAEPVTLGEDAIGSRGIFPVLDRRDFEGIELEILGGLGGHLAGHLYFYSEEHGLLFTGDTLFNLKALSPERREFNSLAVNLILSVDVKRETAVMERRALLAMAQESTRTGGRCIVCGGHGPLSVVEGDALVPLMPVKRWP